MTTDKNIECPQCSSTKIMPVPESESRMCYECQHEFVPEKPFVPQRVFISYGHDEHVSLALRLRDDLKERGHEAWFDEDRLKPGYDWEAGIEEGLQWAAEAKPDAAVILLLTPHSVRRPRGYCLNEVARALALGLDIIPLMVVESEPPLSICRIQWLDMRPCIPIHEKEEIYRPKFERLLEALEEDKLDFEGTQSRLLSALQPIQFSADILDLLRNFTGRRWVFEEVDAWLRGESEEKVFWISGAPGVGKSAIAAWLRENRREIAAFHFCDAGSEEKRDPARLVRSVAYQLSTQLPEYQERLARLDLDSIVGEYRGAYTLFDKLIVQPLSGDFPAPDRTVVVLIDALDEATHDRDNEIVSFLAESVGKTPAWLRFLVTSRPEPEIVGPFRGLDPYVLDTEREDNLRDLRDYLHKRFPDITPEQTEIILDRSEGVFLYVEQVCKEIEKGHLSLERPDEFPRGLSGIYHRFFKRQFGDDLTYYEEKITPLLQPILAAYEPLTLGLLQDVCGIDSQTELGRRLNRLGSLFPTTGEESDDIIQPFHNSLRDWLTSREAAGHFYIAVLDGHDRLADHGLQQRRRGAEVMAKYHIHWLPEHLVSAERWHELIGDAETPGVLTDLLFVQAKCEAGMVHGLVGDYNAALAALPAFREERAYLARRDAAMRAYHRALNAYAVERCDYLKRRDAGAPCAEPEYPERPAILRDENRPPIPEETSPRAARLRHFANFVSGHTGLLGSSPDETLPIALNRSEEGPVSERAERRIEEQRMPVLARSPRPPTRPLRPPCLRTLEGHTRSVRSVSISPDGRRAVSGSDDNTVRLWDLQTGDCLRSLEGHSARVMSVSISPDGRRAVFGSHDNTVRVWDLETGDCLRTLEGHSDWVWSVSISPDGRRAVSGSRDNTVRLWDLQTGDCLRTLEGHSDWVRSVRVSPDGRRAVFGSSDHTVRVWDLETGDCLRTLEGHSDVVNSVSISPDGRRALSGGHDETVRLWDLETGDCLRTFKGHQWVVASVSVSPDGRRAVSGSGDKTVRLWDLERWDCLRSLEGHSDVVNSVSVSPDGRRAVSGGGNILASKDNTVRLWDLETGDCLRTLEGHSGPVDSVSISPDGRRALSGSSGSTVRLWDLQTGDCLRTLDEHSGPVNSVSISPDGRRAASGSKDRTVRLWDLQTGDCLRSLEGHSGSVTSVGISPDGRRTLSGSWDNTLRLWDLETGDCLRTLRGHSGDVDSVCFTPDGRRALSGSRDDPRRDNTVRLWDLQTGGCLCTLEGHSLWVLSVSISPDGRRAVSGSLDRTVRLWDLDSGQCLAVYRADFWVFVTAVAPSGERIVCGTRDGQMHFLTAVNCPPPGPPILTISRFPDAADARTREEARCPRCADTFNPQRAIVDAITALTRHLTPEQSPCLDLPAAAFEEPRLLADCPHCGRPLKFNPFFVDMAEGPMGNQND